MAVQGTIRSGEGGRDFLLYLCTCTFSKFDRIKPIINRNDFTTIKFVIMVNTPF